MQVHIDCSIAASQPEQGAELRDHLLVVRSRHLQLGFGPFTPLRELSNYLGDLHALVLEVHLELLVLVALLLHSVEAVAVHGRHPTVEVLVRVEFEDEGPHGALFVVGMNLQHMLVLAVALQWCHLRIVLHVNDTTRGVRILVLEVVEEGVRHHHAEAPLPRVLLVAFRDEPATDAEERAVARRLGRRAFDRDGRVAIRNRGTDPKPGHDPDPFLVLVGLGRRDAQEPSLGRHAAQSAASTRRRASGCGPGCGRSAPG
mmetsp:Transcript_7513/g.19144  ORF Transcript_7513/g.19144 Transcript_7513/m.19144 type:complete len:258 (-) Transcript_7513:30-803(-)